MRDIDRVIEAFEAESKRMETEMLRNIANGKTTKMAYTHFRHIFPTKGDINWTQEDIEDFLAEFYELRPPEIDQILMAVGYSTYREHLNPPLSKLIPSIMNDFDTETDVDNAMDSKIESMKEENYFTPAEQRVMTDLLSDHRHFKEKLFLEGNLPGQMEIGSSGSFGLLWTEEEKRLFARVGVKSLNQSKEAKQ